MYQVKQVLLPVDFSSFSRCAVAFARNLGPESPRLQMVHVLDDLSPAVRNILFPYAALGEDEVEFEHELITEAYEHLTRYFRVDKELERLFIDEPIVRMGKAKALLGELIRGVDAELVVMGAFGQGGVHPEALGSTAERLLRTVIQPTILVRDFDPSPRLQHIVVAVDLTPQSVHVFGKALGLALQTGASLEAIYVLPHPFAQDTHKLLSSQLRFNPRQILNRSEDKIDALFERMRQQVQVLYPMREAAAERMKKWQVLVGDPAAEITRHAYETNADLVVVGSHSVHSKSNQTLGRVAWTVARTSPTHVMVVPPETQPTLLNDE